MPCWGENTLIPDFLFLVIGLSLLGGQLRYNGEIKKKYKLKKKDERIVYRLCNRFFSILLFILLAVMVQLYNKKKCDTEFCISFLLMELLWTNDIWYRICNDLRNYIETRSKTLESKAVYYKKRLDEIEKVSENTRNLRHDLVNHMNCIYAVLEQEHVTQAKKYIEDLLKKELYFQPFLSSKSGNLTIDCLLSSKREKMKQLHIKLYDRIEIPSDIVLNEVDISIIIGNCMDNAIEAVSQIKEESKREISLEILYRKGCFFFKISNFYGKNIKRNRKGGFKTTKKNESRHGLGLEIVEKTLKIYNGFMKVDITNHKFTLQLLLYLSI